MYHVEAYTKLAREAMDAWHIVEQEAEHKLVDHCGSIQLTEKGSPFMVDTVQAAIKQGMKYEHLTGSEFNRRYPQFKVDDSVEALIDPEGGLVDAAQANAVHVALARQRGATVVDKCKVFRIQQQSASRLYEIATSCGKVTADKIIVTAGAWANQALGNFGVHVPLTITQEQVQYYATPHIQDFLPAKFPVWIWVHDNLSFYGLPIHGIMGVKIAIDCGGAAVTADQRSFTPDKLNTEKTDEFVKKFFPKAYGPKALVKTCLYTMPPDRNFVVDTLAGYGHPNVSVCVGGGHAFKFASVLGKVLTDLSTKGRTATDIALFSLYRTALTDPNYPDLCRQFSIEAVETKSKL
ncbi:monomeric sarcosine oxidase-like isoform X2 [Sycon ciliatum]